MIGWPDTWRRLAVAGLRALVVAGLAACTRPAPAGPLLPTLEPATAAPSLSAAAPATDTAAPELSDTPAISPSATTVSATAAASAVSTGSAVSGATPTVQTATPLFVAELPTLGPDPAASPIPPNDQPTLPPPAPTTAASTAPAPETAAAPAITQFTIEPAEILPGQPVTLTWQASADQVTLQRIDVFGRLGEFFNVGASGSQVLSTPSEQRGYVEFVLFASRAGESVQATARATILCPDTWFFPNPPPECPASPPHVTAIQAQPFEHGLMLWTEYNDFIYALYGDGGHPRWDSWANAWFPGQPESDPSLAPPAGLYQPVRGFGVAWRTGYVSPTQVVRDRLGWATAPEAPVPNARAQCDSLPRYSRCYLTGPGGAVYVLHPERSGWEIHSQ